MFKLIKATAIVSIATIAAIFAGLVKAKFTALALGPAGVGIFSQAANFLQLLVTVSTLGIGLGVTKFISKYNSEGNIDGVKGIVSGAFFMQTIVCCIAVFVIAVFSGPFSRMLFATGEYSLYLVIGSIGIPFLVLAVTSETVILGFGNYRSFTKAKSLSVLLGLVPLVLLVYFMKIEGAFLYLAIGGIVTFLVYFIILCRNVPEYASPKQLAASGMKGLKNGIRTFGKDLLSYGGTTFAGGILGMINIVLLRSLVIRRFGPEANGFYQVVFTMSSYYLMFFTNGLWSYFYPKVSATEDGRRFSVEVNYALRFAIFGMAPIVTGLFLFRYMLIHLVFSQEFIVSADLFATQLFGDLFFLLFYIMGTSLMAGSKLKMYLVFNAAYSAVLIGSFLLLMHAMGIKAITASYLVTNLVMFTAVILYYIKKAGLVLYMRNAKLLASASALLLVILFIGKDTLVAGALKTALIAAWAFFLSRPAEKNKFKKFVYGRVKGLFGYGR